MWLSFLCSILFTVAAEAAVTVKAKVYDIDYGQGDEDTFLLLTSGHVAWIKNTQNKSKSINFEVAKNANRLMTFELNDGNELISAKLATSSLDSHEELAPKSLNVEETYYPTIMENLESAKTLFKEARYLMKDSQCYNRAHVWSFEWFENHKVNSNKTWVFFTRRYIRKFKFEWWFHVAPSVAVNEAGVVREKVMDIKYARGPLDLKRWTDIFMRDDANCPNVKTYSDYANYPESGSCYTMRTSMFYYQPFDIETRETWGIIKDEWIAADVKQAYLEAFDEEI